MDARLAAHLELAALSDEEFVRRAYRLILRRDPEPEAFARRAGRATLLQELVASEEFGRLRALDDAIAALGANEGPARFLEASAEADERAIEIPWALSRYRGELRVLDVGSAHAEPAYLAALVAAAPGEPVGVDLVEVEIPGLETVVADVRQLPFDDRSFDVALCISTLEHVGADNRLYGAGGGGAGPEAALHELRRVLDRNGRLILTVPTGEPEQHGWFEQRDPDGWNGLFVAAGFRVVEEEVYELDKAGWRAATAFDPAGVRYGARGAGASAVLCAELEPVSAARRAVRRVRAAGRPRGA